MEFLAYLAAPLIAIFMDKMYFISAIGIIHGFFPVKRKYKYRNFANKRLILTALSSIIIAWAGINKNILFGMIGASIFLISHFLIYLTIYRREREPR